MERKLTAIMAADVVGYSRMMGADEAGTLAALKVLRTEVIDPTIAEHRGRTVKLMGDGALVEFDSVVDALTCAVATQRGMAGRNADVPAERRIAFRIGINLGDIIVDSEGWIRKGVELAEKAIEMDPKEPLGYMQLGNLVQFQGDHDWAIALREKAVELAPNDMAANWGLGVVLYKAGQAERGVEHLKRAERLAPQHPASLTWALAQGQLIAGHYDDAIESAKRAIARVPNRSLPHIQLTAAYTALGRMEEARGAAAEVLRIDPKFTISGWKRQNADYKDHAAVDLLASLLVQAGLPE